MHQFEENKRNFCYIQVFILNANNQKYSPLGVLLVVVRVVVVQVPEVHCCVSICPLLSRLVLCPEPQETLQEDQDVQF